MQTKKLIGLLVASLIILGSILYLESGKVRPMGNNIFTTGNDSIPVETTIRNTETAFISSSSLENVSGTVLPKPVTVSDRIKEKSKKYDRIKEISSPDGFINLPTGKTDFKLADIVGKKVILIDFWTYSCINCQRTTPYLNAWYQKYKDQGLEIVGIHTPEFDFEKDYQNVLVATKEAGIQFPVALDNDYSTWTAYKNRFWPRKYLVDIDGFIIYDHIGEGAYDETEKKIQTALKERNAVLGLSENPMPTTTVSFPSGGTLGTLISPETYFGSLRNENFGSGAPGKSGVQTFEETPVILPHTLYLPGTWNITSQYAETPPGTGGSEMGSQRINFRYQAKGVYFVAGSTDNALVEIEVLRDSKPIPASVAGPDVFFKDGKSYIRVKEHKLYRLIDEKVTENHLLEMIISAPGLRAYTFTFG